MKLPRLPPWPLAALLFLLTIASTYWAGGPRFAAALLSILVAHELGHYVAARVHGVEASPPYFIPFPLSLLGTMGAVIQMPGRIRRRDQLFDIGASGPLAGLAVALPVLYYGLSISRITPLSGTVTMEGKSLLYVGMLRIAHGVIPEGSDVLLSDVALAGWAGLLVTMINLLPVGQLDGGHVAYALFGPAQDRVSRLIHRLLLVVALGVGAREAYPALAARAPWSEVLASAALGMHWLVWYVVLHVIARMAGPAHPPTDDDVLSPGRRALAVFTLALFPLLFMPWWMRVQTF